MKNKKDHLWIISMEQIPNASDGSLKRGLITLDGAGKIIKEAILEELLKRMYSTKVKNVDKEFYKPLDEEVDKYFSTISKKQLVKLYNEIISKNILVI